MPKDVITEQNRPTPLQGESASSINWPFPSFLVNQFPNVGATPPLESENIFLFLSTIIASKNIKVYIYLNLSSIYVKYLLKLLKKHKFVKIVNDVIVNSKVKGKF